MTRIPLTARWLLVWATIVALPGSAFAQGLGALRFEQYLEALRQQAGIPGLSAAIVQDRVLAWERGFGSADLERNIPATPDTPYPVAGITAAFSAVQALQCVERGLLHFDTPVGEFFPAFFDPAALVWQAMSQLTSTGQFAFDPLRYDAVAAAIKTCTNQTLRGALAESILDRFVMFDSIPGHDFPTWSPGTLAQFEPEVAARYASTMTRLARSYRVSNRGKPTLNPFAPTTGLTGASGIVSSARDLARFQIALDDGALLEAETLKVAWTAHALPDGRRLPHVLGWFATTYEGQPVLWQYGVVPDAYSALVMTLPQRGVTLILLANSDGLVEPFPLANGELAASPFALLFLRLFS